MSSTTDINKGAFCTTTTTSETSSTDSEGDIIFQTLDFKFIFPDSNDYATFKIAENSYNISIDFTSMLSGLLSVAQDTAINIATERGTDTVYTTRGTLLRESARNGVVVNTDQLVHVTNIAAYDSQTFINDNVMSSLSDYNPVNYTASESSDGTPTFTNSTNDTLNAEDAAQYIEKISLTPTTLTYDSVLLTLDLTNDKGEEIATNISTFKI